MKRLSSKRTRLTAISASLLLPLGWYAGSAQAFLLSYYDGGLWTSCSTAGACDAAVHDFDSQNDGFVLTGLHTSGDGRWYRVDWQAGDPEDAKLNIRARNQTGLEQNNLTIGVAREPGQSLGRRPPTTAAGTISTNQYLDYIATAEDFQFNNLQVTGATDPEDRNTYPENFEDVPVSHVVTSTFSLEAGQVGYAGLRYASFGWQYSDAIPLGKWDGIFDPQYVGDVTRSLYIYEDFGPIDLLASTPSELVEAVPIPGAVWLFGSALFGFWSVARRDSDKRARGGTVV